MTFDIPISAIASYVFRSPDWGPVGEVVYKRTYEYNSEGWAFTCKRVVELCYTLQKRHCIENGRPWDDSKALASALEMYDLMFSMKFLPPGRGLDCGRIDLVDKKGGAVLNNCGFISTAGETDADPFVWAMDMLALGVGVGFDTLGKFRVQKFTDAVQPLHVVADSREGWCEAYRLLLNSYLVTGISVDFDFSQIRSAGEPLKTIGGTSSGPEPLKQLIRDTRELLYRHQGKELKQSTVADIFMLIGRCIVSGNKRRSAELGLGTAADFMEMKAPVNGKNDHPFRWAANLSVTLSPSDDHSEVAKHIEAGNELGIFWLENAQNYSRMGRRPDGRDSKAAGTNPCSEQTLESKELCCLVEVFPSRHTDYYDLQHTLKYAYLYAKSVTLAKTHDPETNAIIARNRRIGCSMSGIVPACEKFGRTRFLSEFLPDGYKYVQALDDRYSAWFGINRSIKTTSVKPSGTVSKLPGVAPGIHWPHSEYYFNVIRFAADSPFVTIYRDAGYDCIDLSPREPNTVAVYFPVKEENFRRSKSDISMWEQLELVAQVQHYWSDNQVSATTTFTEAERPQIKHAIELYSKRLKSVTFFPNEISQFEHAPMQAITKEQYDDYVAKLSPVALPSTREQSDKFCDSESCEI